jgi:hypothetical protein
MTLVISKGLTLRKGWQPMDADAAAYIAAVETADTEPLEEKTKIAIDNFVLGCKADGIWSAIKASCILAGARTLAGALTPLAGTAPTNVGGLFVSGDYNRKTGLIGNGSTKYLNSNRNNNADPQDNHSQGVFINTAQPSGIASYIGVGAATTTGSTHQGVDYNLSTTFHRSRFGNVSTGRSSGQASTGLFGMTRSSGSLFTYRVAGTSTASNIASEVAASGDVYVFGRNVSNAISLPIIGRLQFYWIGEALDLALLDARVTDLINAIGAAIP